MRLQNTVAALAAVALLAAGCGGRSGSSGEEEGSGNAVAVDFGDLKGVCGPGKAATKASAQGVTAKEIKLGVFTDMGFTKKSEFVDAAKVFTTWCNEAGGINGRKLVAGTRDAKFVEVRQRMIEACREDFALVGGGAGLDAMGVKDRLSCLLPSFPAQTSQAGNVGSDLQVETGTRGASYALYAGYFKWLLTEAYPGSKDKVGVIAGDSPVVKVKEGQFKESIVATGGKVAYSELYPTQGVSDWTPYAQSIKSKGIKGLIFLGDLASLAKLEQVLTNLDYKLDWIDANSNAYGPAFIQLAGKSAGFQNNLADLSGVAPLESASGNPATRQVIDLFNKHAPGKEVNLQVLRAFSTWTLFAKAAASCGDDLTRTCVYEAAMKETAWTGGGLQAPVDLSKADAPVKCFNVVQATPQGWKPADFKPDKGAYRCDAPEYRLRGAYPKPLTLTDVGKKLSDVK